LTYISQIDTLLSLKNAVTSVKDLLDLSVLEKALAIRAAILIKESHKAISEST